MDALLGSAQRGGTQANMQTRSKDTSGQMWLQFESAIAAQQALQAAAAVSAAAGTDAATECGLAT